MLLAAIDGTFDATLSVDADLIVGSGRTPSKFRIDCFQGILGTGEIELINVGLPGLSIPEYVIRASH